MDYFEICFIAIFSLCENAATSGGRIANQSPLLYTLKEEKMLSTMLKKS